MNMENFVQMSNFIKIQKFCKKVDDFVKIEITFKKFYIKLNK